MKTCTMIFTWSDGSQAIGVRLEDSIDDMQPTTWQGDPERIASLPDLVRDSATFSFREGSGRRNDAEVFAKDAGARLEFTDSGDWDYLPDDIPDPNE